MDFVALFSFIGRKGAGYEAVLSVILRGFLFLMVGGLFSKLFMAQMRFVLKYFPRTIENIKHQNSISYKDS